MAVSAELLPCRLLSRRAVSSSVVAEYAGLREKFKGSCMFENLAEGQVISRWRRTRKSCTHNRYTHSLAMRTNEDRMASLRILVGLAVCARAGVCCGLTNEGRALFSCARTGVMVRACLRARVCCLARKEVIDHRCQHSGNYFEALRAISKIEMSSTL